MYGLTDNELEKLCNLFRKHEEIEQAVLYGSRAKGNFKPFSDIDITLMGDRLSDEIDDLLLPYSVDLSIYGKLKNADLLEHIHRMGIPIFSRPSN